MWRYLPQNSTFLTSEKLKFIGKTSLKSLKGENHNSVYMKEKAAVLCSYYPNFVKVKVDAHFITPQTEMNLADSDPIIVLGSFMEGRETEKAKEEFLIKKREREIFNALEKGKIVCFLFKLDRLLTDVFKRAEIKYDIWSEPRVDIKCRLSEFQSLISDFGTTKYGWRGNLDNMIAETEDGAVVGFSKKVRKGWILFLPLFMHIDYFWREKATEMLPILIEALEKHKLRVQYQAPKWVDAFRFPAENDIFTNVDEMQKKLQKEMNKLSPYKKLKEILWLRNKQLELSIIDFLSNIGIMTKRVEKSEEDFWIIENDQEVAIVEIKGLDSNLKRGHINRLDTHREAAEKPEKFPGLLIVNSFNKAESIEEKDQAISTNEVEKAVRTNVLIMRTMDLCNFEILRETEKMNLQQLMHLIKNERGWLKITKSDYEIRHK